VDEYLAFSNIGAYSYPRTSKDTRFQMLEIVLPWKFYPCSSAAITNAQLERKH